VEQPAQLIAQHRIRIERRMQLGACLESIHLQGFVGREAPEELRQQYVGKRVPEEYRKQGAANPIKYVAAANPGVT
jgi:hypothetical protein